MNPAIIALIGFAIWTIFLGIGVISIRTFKVLKGEKKSNEFPSGVEHGSSFYWRLNRAHVNCVENLPIFATLVLIGAFVGVLDSTFALVAKVILGARLVQTVAHLSSGSEIAVNIRFTAFVTQYGSFLSLIWQILHNSGMI
ncbi:MAPEG family protein [Leptospira stimsonii]|uniref:MAPEG family protein n=1 Tax=Leptospira stimsonii TaxID=2202203 RepID=A0A4R9L543_9LEPT|nr:MAPEG family protein [Leptospira stimsonii]RHX88329.1 MAPEG family protein [Leptospira stimsonii]TGK22184.1 MAPEG family protein [Leptospira stimsonii]TGM17205.1 MAPEG family protein [Leptospira stimsonii]